MKKLLNFMVLAIIWLIMTLPVAVSQQTLTIQKFAGQDGVNGYAKEGDTLTVEILAEMLGNPTESVAVQRARVYNEETYEFMDSCDPQAQAIQQCTYETDDIVFGGTDEYEVKLFDSNNNEIASESRELTVDFLGPQIITFAVSPKLASQPLPTTITYKADDYGTTTGETKECSGIKIINFTANGELIGADSAEVGDCSVEGSFRFTPSISGESEIVTVCAVAYDHLNHKSLPRCEDILIDSRKPTPSDLELRDSNGYSITHARSSQQVTADVFVRIPDVDIDPTTVKADLSDLNPSLGKIVREDQQGEWFIWRNVAVTSPDTCKVTAEAKDFMGNTDSKTLTCSIGIDDDAPEPTAIRTQFVDEDSTPLLGVNGTIYVDFTESGSGMDKANAFLDLRELGRGREVKADRCDKQSGNSWTCEWEIIPTVASGDYKVDLQPITRDDLDNQVTQTIEQDIRFDNTAPGELTIVEIAAFRGDDRVVTNVTSRGEVIEFVVAGAGYTEATADLSDLGGTSDATYDRCFEDNLTRTCVFSVTTAVSGPQPTNVSFIFSDVAGNTATLSTNELFILGITNESDPNYWTLSTSCSPSLLDRSTLSIYDHPVYCKIDMETTNSQASPITVIGPFDPFTECEGDLDYVSSMSVENNYAGSSEPYLALSLISTDYEINNLTFTCPMSIMTRVGNFIPQNFENDNITVELEFYNLPLGDLYNNIDDEVDDVTDKIGGVWEVIGKLQKFLGYAEKLCTILNIIMTLITIIAGVIHLLAFLEIAVNAIPIFGPAAAQSIAQTERGMCAPNEVTRSLYNDDGGLLTILKKFCDFLTCQAGLFDILTDVGVGGVSDIDFAGATGFNDLLNPTGADTTGIYPPSDAPTADVSTYLNVKDSLVYSIMIPPLCIPGIIYNLDKWRQIECRYGLCLLEEVRMGGMPVSVCKDQKQYMQCRFVMGEIFNIIPFAAIVNFYLEIFQRALSDPLVLAGIGLAYLLDCKAACLAPAKVGIVYNICAGAAIASQLGDTINNIRNFKSVADIGSVDSGWCEEFEDTYDEYKAAAERGGGQ